MIYCFDELVFLIYVVVGLNIGSLIISVPNIIRRIVMLTACPIDRLL